VYSDAVYLRVRLKALHIIFGASHDGSAGHMALYIRRTKVGNSLTIRLVNQTFKLAGARPLYESALSRKPRSLRIACIIIMTEPMPDLCVWVFGLACCG